MSIDVDETEYYAIWAPSEEAALRLLTGDEEPSEGYDRGAVEAALGRETRGLRFTDGDRLEWNGEGWIFVEFVDEARIDVSYGPTGGLAQGKLLGEITGTLAELGFHVYDLAEGDWIGRRRAPDPPAAPAPCQSCGEVIRPWPCERCEDEIATHCPECHLEVAHF